MKWKRVLVGIVAIVACVLLAGASYQFLSHRRDLRQHPAPGRMIDVGGYRLHLDCTGRGSPTVVFDSGLSDDSISWHKVQPEIAKITRACSYDRAGLGWSDPSPFPRTSATIALELHRLLARGGVAAPYILVGHSLGGFNVRMFAALYPSETSGVVLVDSVFPFQYKRLPASMSAYNEHFLRRLGYFEDTMPFGWPRLSGWCDHWPTDTRDERRTTECALRPWRTHLAEYRAFDEDSAEVVRARPLGNLPLFVLSHDPGSNPSPAERAWSQMQNELAELSPRSTHVVVSGSGHVIQEDNPQVVVDAIRAEIEEARTGDVLRR